MKSMARAHAIMGPPGTGKSTYLAKLIKELAVTESNMAVVSFTKAAAGVLTSKVSSNSVRYVGTLHALAFKVLGLTKTQVVDEDKFAKWYGADVEEVQMAMSVYRHSYHTGLDLPQSYACMNPTLPFMRLEHLVLSFINWVREYQYVTFDQMIEMATDLFINEHHQKFHTVVVDEAQDMTNKQWDMVQSILLPTGRLIIAGDDDQAVYTWAGANPHAMTELSDTHEVLSQSYRIPASVHNLAENVVKRISKRTSKEYKPRAVDGKVEHVSYYEPMMYQNPHTILCRDKWVMKEVEEQLIERAIPYSCNGHMSLFDRGRAKLIRAILSEDHAGVKRHSRYLRKTYQEDPYQAIKVGWQKAVDLGSYQAEARYLSLVDHEAPILVNLSTIHGAKGEEGNHIILIGQCSGQVEMAMDNTTTYDDELRVWYVGITRAKETLTIVGWNQYIQ